MSLDPLSGAFPSWSAYNYVFDNPVVFVDPDGRMPTGGEQENNETEDEMVMHVGLGSISITPEIGPGQHSKEFIDWARGYLQSSEGGNEPENWSEEHGSYGFLARSINKFGAGRTMRYDPVSRERFGTGSGLATVHLTTEEWEIFADVVGSSELPIISQAGDLSAAMIAMARGDNTGAVLSVGGALPGLGLGFAAVKWVRRGGKWVKKVDEAADGVNNSRKAGRNYPKDFSTKNTVNKSGYYKTEREARNLAREKIGRNPVEVGPNKLRSQDGRWQYRGKPQDLTGHGPGDGPHIHLERLNPNTGEVLENWHLRW